MQGSVKLNCCLFNKNKDPWNKIMVFKSVNFDRFRGVRAGRYSDQVWKSTTWFSEEWKISVIATYTVLGTIKKWQWHGFLHGNLSSLIRIYHKKFWTAIFFMGEILLPAREVVRLLQKAWVSRQKREISHVCRFVGGGAKLSAPAWETDGRGGRLVNQRVYFVQALTKVTLKWKYAFQPAYFLI